MHIPVCHISCGHLCMYFFAAGFESTLKLNEDTKFYLVMTHVGNFTVC